MKGYIEVDTDRCKGCRLCEEVCPRHCIRISSKVNQKGYCYAELTARELCSGCTSCGIMCPDGCITVFRDV